VERERGMTMIEILVTLAILGLVIGAIAVQRARVPETALREDAMLVAATLRSAFDRALSTGAYHRVLIDIDAGTVRAERCEGKVILRRNLPKPEELPDAGMPLDLGMGGAAALGGSAGTTPVTCAPVKGSLGKGVALRKGRGVKIRRVYLARLDEPLESGQVTLTFFPEGFTERAVIELAGDSDTVFSIIVHPQSGRVEAKPGEWRGAERHVTEDDEGKELTE
jgi:prepilin-type N-terminal cleavage/methylation domain-containing protein